MTTCYILFILIRGQISEINNKKKINKKRVNKNEINKISYESYF